MGFFRNRMWRGLFGDKIVDIREQALELAVQLRGSEGVIMGPTDSDLCADALQHYARARLHKHIIRKTTVPALALAVILGLFSMLGTDTTAVATAADPIVVAAPVSCDG